MGMRCSLSAWRVPVVAGVMALLLVGCEEDVVSVRGTDVPFTLYGVFMPEADTQRVRVFPVEDQLQPARPEPLDAHFTSTDLQTGQVRVWRDSLLREADGRYTHVFWSPFQAAYGHTYRLDVTRSDGAVTRVEVVVPPRVELVSQEPVLFEGSTHWSPITVPVLARGAPRLRQLEVEYYVQTDFDDSPLPFGKERVVFEYQTRVKQIDGAWFIGINLFLDRRDMGVILSELGLANRQYGFKILDMTLRMVVVNEAWDPRGGTFDPELLAQPGVLQNVENGYGFVGAGYHLEQNWRPPDEALEAAGFRIR